MPDSFLTLGAAGDLCAVLPLFENEAKRTKERQKVIVSRDYADLLEGTSYIEPIIYDGSYRDVRGALNFAISQDLSPLVVQAGFNPALKPSCSSFVEDMWNLAGQRDNWFVFRPNFDRRDKGREAALLKQIGRTPDVLVAVEGRSSPFPHSAHLVNLLSSKLPGVNILNLSAVKVERLYDIVGLYEKAKVLVSIDTVHLHMAGASDIPVVALVTDQRSRWHGCPAYSNQVFRCRYSTYEERSNDLVRAVRRVLRGTFGSKEPRQIVHVFSDYDRSGAAHRRHMMARRTWEEEARFGDWIQKPLRAPGRDSTLVGDSRGVPFIKDLLAHACVGADDRDIIALSNDDTNFVPGLTQEILSKIDDGPLYAHRWDSMEPIEEPLYKQQVEKLRFYPGCDAFFCTVKWWKDNEGKYPEQLLLGSEAWDWVMRELMKEDCGTELHYAAYHERHSTDWARTPEVRLKHPANIHNRRLARKFLSERGIALAEIGGID